MIPNIALPTRALACLLALGAGAAALRDAGQSSAASPVIPAGWTAERLKPIAYTDLDGRGGAFKMAIREVQGRWFLYMGHLWHRGWSIVDVTDPARPSLVKFVPWPQDNTWTIQMDLHDNIMITALERAIPGWGGDPAKPADEGVVIWDISDPVQPKQLSHWRTGGGGTHRNSYPGGKYAYLAANMPGFSGPIFVILDVSDPRKPKEAGRWWLPGQKEGEPPLDSGLSGFPTGLHGPPVVIGQNAYLGHGPAVVILDISDVSRPRLVGRLNVSPPFGLSMVAVHTVAPIPGKPLLFASSEAIAGDGPDSASCDEPYLMSALINIKNPANPQILSLFPRPTPPDGAGFADFCDKGARFGPHNVNQHWHSPDVQQSGDLVYLTYFNAGLRVFDIREPRQPKEVAWFVPPTPTKRYGPIPTGRLVTQTEDVLVDRRGNVYVTDKQWGLWVLTYSGPGSTASQ